MVLIPNTTGVESANTNVIGRRSPVARENGLWVSQRSIVAIQRQSEELIGSLKTKWGMLPSNIARKQKIYGRLFFN